MHDESPLPPTWSWHTASTLPLALNVAGLPPGARLGEYEVLGVLGRGGMGVVYRARQPAADRIVALKVIRGDKLTEHGDEERRAAVQRFLTEARAAARLHHDHLVTVFEVGEAEGCPYYSMRLVEGRSLADLLRERPLSSRQAAAYLEPVCRAIEEVHRQGILHRDIKPSNILIDEQNDRPLVADFGLAKLAGGGDATLAGGIFGSPPYMSPEQARDAGGATAASDVYSLGATLYHALCGRPPFQAATPKETLAQVLSEDPAPPRQLNAAIDRDLETICLKCLEREPSRRYQSAGDLADELARYGRREPIRARPLGLSGRAWRWARRNPRLAILSAVLFVALGFAAGTLWQLDAVAFERDRAVGAESLATTRRDEALAAQQAAEEAERLKKAALADSLANQGLLAMQRGRMRDAPAIFDQAIAEGYPDAVRLRLEKVEAWVATRNIDAAAAELAALAALPDLGSHRGEVLLWQAELALGPRPDESAEALLQSALDAGLPPAEEHYAQGMLAENSPEAIEHFAAALRLDPFYHPAHGASAMLLLLSGRLEETERQLAAGMVLFPEDAVQVMCRAAVAAIRGDVAAAQAHLDGAGSLSEGERAFARELMPLLDHIARSANPVSDAESGELLAQILRLIPLMKDANLPEGGGLPLPPRIKRRFTPLLSALVPLQLGFSGPVLGALKELIAVHPEGTLHLWLGIFAFSEERYEEAIAAFAAAEQLPAVGRGVAELAGTLGAMCTAFLAVRGEVHPELLPAAIGAVRKRMAAGPLDRYQIDTVATVFAAVAREAGEFALGRQVLAEWESLEPESVKLQASRMHLEYRAGGYQAALEAADRVLAVNADYPQAAEVRAKALEKLKAAVEGM